MPIKKIFEALPFRNACVLHQRLTQGRTDKKTRSLLRAGLAKAGMGRVGVSNQ